MNWIKSTPISHRGLHDAENPENSLGAFQNSLDKKYAIELDVRITKDGKIVVFHDIETSRLTKKNFTLKDTTLDTLESLSLLETNFKIPSLEKVLKFVDGSVPLLIEIKNEGPVGKLEMELIRILDSYNGDFAIQSFNPLSLKLISKRRPDFKIGLLVGSFNSSKLSLIKKIALKYMLLTPYLSPDFFSVEYGVDILAQKLMLKLYSEKPVVFWTISDKGLGKKLLKSGSGIIFEGFNLK